MDENELEIRFTYHPPTGNQYQRYTDIRDAAHGFALFLNANCPESRELALAITKLEEVVFWANASIARREKVV